MIFGNDQFKIDRKRYLGKMGWVLDPKTFDKFENPGLGYFLLGWGYGGPRLHILQFSTLSYVASCLCSLAAHTSTARKRPAVRNPIWNFPERKFRTD